MTDVFFANALQTAPPPVMLAHSAERLDQNSAEWVARLCDRRVVVFNPSVSEALDPGADLFEQMVDEIELARRDELNEPVVFWGMSGGAWLGQLLAKRHPDSLHALMLESGCACFRERLADARCVMSLASDGSIASPIPLSERMQRTTAAMLAFDSRSWLSQIHVPTLVLASRDDPVCPSVHSERLARAIPDTRLVCFDGSAHVPSMAGVPAAVAAVKTFLMDLN